MVQDKAVLATRSMPADLGTANMLVHLLHAQRW